MLLHIFFKDILSDTPTPQAISTQLKRAPLCLPSSPSPPVTSPSPLPPALTTQNFSLFPNAQASMLSFACDKDPIKPFLKPSLFAASLTPKVCASTPSITTSPVCSGPLTTDHFLNISSIFHISLA